jgi:predicted Zn-dependent protease
VCGAALRRNSAFPPGGVSCACTACALQYLEDRRECAFCDQVLLRTGGQVASRGAGVAAINEPPASRNPVSGPAPRTYVQPLGVPTQKRLPSPEVSALFRLAGQQISQTLSTQVKQNLSGLRSRAPMIFTLLLIAGLGVAGWIWGVPLTERFWAWWTILSTPASIQPTSVPPKGVHAERRVVTSPSVRPSKTEAHNVRGFELAQAGDVEGAIAEFRRAVSADPKNFKAHNNLGVLYKQKGLSAQAISEYMAASKADPTNPLPYKNMAILYDEQGRLPKALRNYARYLERAPNASDAEVIRSRVRDLRSKTENKPAR